MVKGAVTKCETAIKSVVVPKILEKSSEMAASNAL